MQPTSYLQKSGDRPIFQLHIKYRQQNVNEVEVFQIPLLRKYVLLAAMKRPFIIILVAIAAFILGWFANEAYTFSKAMKADKFADYQLKPKTVPSGAFWAGGVDGGNWYLVKEINAHRNKASIEIYSDQNGSLVLSKTFTLICPVDHQVLISNLKEQVSGFDGEKIYLLSKDQSKTCYLQ